MNIIPASFTRFSSSNEEFFDLSKEFQKLNAHDIEGILIYLEKASKSFHYFEKGVNYLITSLMENHSQYSHAEISLDLFGKIYKILSPHFEKFGDHENFLARLLMMVVSAKYVQKLQIQALFNDLPPNFKNKNSIITALTQLLEDIVKFKEIASNPSFKNMLFFFVNKELTLLSQFYEDKIQDPHYQAVSEKILNIV